MASVPLSAIPQMSRGEQLALAAQVRAMLFRLRDNIVWPGEDGEALDRVDQLMWGLICENDASVPPRISEAAQD